MHATYVLTLQTCVQNTRPVLLVTPPGRWPSVGARSWLIIVTGTAENRAEVNTDTRDKRPHDHHLTLDLHQIDTGLCSIGN